MTEADCKTAFTVAANAMRDTGADRQFLLRMMGTTDDGLSCVAGLYDRKTNQRSEVVVEWTPEPTVLQQRFVMALPKP